MVGSLAGSSEVELSKSLSSDPDECRAFRLYQKHRQTFSGKNAKEHLVKNTEVTAETTILSYHEQWHPVTMTPQSENRVAYFLNGLVSCAYTAASGHFCTLHWSRLADSV